ncbi:UDP-N-acetylglucosamine 1-carboxyvinyltransferase [Vallitalea longa]|uniref:UDP-N-acetylglucosamine 1-carboxyvinyltransferase n=1 Tax=Vallitalea longa TaxID=2936439 RepID=A0A9W5YG55_9FIRM|nr:UDP-N-acetylglucosamine 1-carboxyvinyltransferase [Vallitalea longa]GKX30583.1 UDP-N-acetylglucosamine 1-carboxyvinyltransferase [Vallitalea longa]
MNKLEISKSSNLKGNVRISGSKNAVLPIIAATILTKEICSIQDVPNLTDVNNMQDILINIGVKVNWKKDDKILEINALDIESTDMTYEDLAQKMRASILMLGPMLTREGHAKISLPGGCVIGSRPIDLHIKGLTALGAKINKKYGYIEAYADKLIGTKIYLDFPSVGATENIMMAAVKAEGKTIIENAAIEPEIVDLANFLLKMGANIKGAGTDTIVIRGVSDLHGVKYKIIPDRIEAGTFMIAAAITGGDITIENIILDHINPIIAKLEECNVKIDILDNKIRVKSDGEIKAADITTLPFPGFPTDMQAPFTALMSIAEGTSVIVETIFENRFMHVDELVKMGADAKVEGRSCIVVGVDKLTGANVSASDLRAGIALLLAALCAEGDTTINNISHIERGYEEVVEKFVAVGANIKKC